MAITGLPLPYEATKAVGISPTPASMEKPAERSWSCNSALLFSSWYPTSANPQICLAVVAYPGALVSRSVSTASAQVDLRAWAVALPANARENTSTRLTRFIGIRLSWYRA